MLMALPLSEHAPTLAFTVVLAVLYLALLRLVDLNEKEPLWAMGLLFSLGAVAYVLVYLLVGSSTLHLFVWPPAIAEESARFAAIAAGAAALWGIGQLRGWREIGGPMDGIVYGAAAGLGLATARVLIQQIVAAEMLGPGFLPGPDLIVRTALAQFHDALFGALIGAGFGAASGSASVSRRILLPLVGLAGAICVHAGYLAYRGASPAGLTLILPLIVVAVFAVIALRQERQAIREHLDAEENLSVDELGALRSLRVRTARSLQALGRADFQRWAGDRVLQQRLVQLALAKQRHASERDPGRRMALETEAARLRAAAGNVRRALTEHAAVSKGSRS